MSLLTEVLVLVLVGALPLAAVGFGIYFFGNPEYEAIDRPVVNTLACASCPRCRRVVGDAAAEEAENAVAHEDAGIRMIQGGYVPAAFAPVWNVQCPHCNAALEFDVESRRLRAEA